MRWCGWLDRSGTFQLLRITSQAQSQRLASTTTEFIGPYEASSYKEANRQLIRSVFAIGMLMRGNKLCDDHAPRVSTEATRAGSGASPRCMQLDPARVNNKLAQPARVSRKTIASTPSKAQQGAAPVASQGCLQQRLAAHGRSRF